MRFSTVSGSTYEVEYHDGGGVRVRRLGNAEGRDGTARQGQDGVWKEALSVGPAEYVLGLPALAIYPDQPIVGFGVLIHWKMNEDGSMNCTQTSKVSKVEV